MTGTIEQCKGPGGDTGHEEFPADEKNLGVEARQATAVEHSLTLWQALKAYRKATLWSICELSPVKNNIYEQYNI